MASTSFSGVASLKLNQVASSKFVASFYACGLRLASSNKYGLHMASYAYDCALRVASNEFGQVASLESGPVAFLFDDCGL